MAYALSDLASILRAAGLVVIEQPDWQTRGHGDMGKIRGVLCHDTAGRAAPDDHSDIATVQNGRPDLPGPLAQLFLSRLGYFYVVAAGKAYHAGYGILDGVEAGTYNENLVGIEAENQGIASDPWPPAQMDAYARGCAALAKHYGFDVAHVLGHKEFALPPGRKIDPDFSMPDLRAAVAKYLGV